MEKIEVLRGKLAKAEAKYDALGVEIASLKKKIAEAETATIIATLKEHNISFADFMKLVKNRNANIAEMVSEDEA